MSLLFDASSFDKLRLGQVELAVACVGGRREQCKLCGGEDQGLGHVLAECTALALDRAAFLSAGGCAWFGMLSGASSGDWPTAVLSPHSGVSILAHAVKFAAATVGKFEKK